MTSMAGLCTSRHNLAWQHNTLHYTETTSCICDGHTEISDIVIMMQEMQMKNELHLPLSFFFVTEATHDWLCRTSYQPRDWKTMHSCLYYIPVTEEMRTSSVCHPVNASHQKYPTWNKHYPHDTLAIHSHLHGYAGCCQDLLFVQC